ncbi:MAG: DUF1566 domain-containing protein [Desulfatirhabdiaceae bacterium]
MHQKIAVRIYRPWLFILSITMLFLLLSNQGYAAPRAVCVSANPSDRSLPHVSYSGAEITLKGIARGDAIEFRWDFGDGSATNWASIQNAFNLGVKHIYSGVVNQLFTAVLQVRNASGEISEDYFQLQLRESNNLTLPDHLDVRIEMAIDAGLWWLHTNMIRNQYAAGSPGYGQSYGYWFDNDTAGAYELAHTGAALDAFQKHGSRLNGDFDNDPYVENVILASNYLLANTHTIAIGAQTAGNPDVNGNGIGLVTNATSTANDRRQTYIGGICMMTLASSDAPNYVSPVGLNNVYGRPLKDIVQDMVDFFAWGQSDPSTGIHRGGWRYWANSGQSDMSTTQWPVLGLLAAETVMGPGKANVQIPAFVRSELAYYLVAMQNTTQTDENGAFSYDGKTTTDHLYNCTKQGTGLICLEFNDAPLTSTPIQSALGYLYRHWNDSGQDWPDNQLLGNSYAMYSVMKGLRIPEPDLVYVSNYDYMTGVQTSERFDWFYNPADQTRVGMATHIVGHQSADGHWDDNAGEYLLKGALSTAWNILSLMSGVTRLTPMAMICDCGRLEFEPSQDISLSATCSFHQDPKRRIVRYEWDFNYDGENFQVDAQGEQTVIENGFATEGYYPVALRVIDDTLNEPQTDLFVCNVYVHLPPHCPLPKAGGPYEGWVGIPLTLSAGASWDPNDDPMKYDWDLDNDGLYGAEDNNCFGQPSDVIGVAPVWTWNDPYNGVIRVRVTDISAQYPSCQKIDFTTVSIGNHSPTCAFCKEGFYGYSGETILLDGSCSEDTDPNDAINYGWDLDGDGNFSDATTSTCLYTIAESHQPGDIIDIALKITDSYGKSTVCYTTVTVVSSDPIEIGYDDGSCDMTTSPWSNEIGSEIAVRFTPASYPVKIASAKFYVPNWRETTTPFEVRVYQANSSGYPGTRLDAGNVTAAATTGNEWVEVDLSSQNIAITEGCFLVSMYWKKAPGSTGQYAQYSCADTTPPISGRTYWKHGASGYWSAPADKNNMIRATVVQSMNNPVISGSVKTPGGTGVSGVTITFSNNGGTAITDSSGNFRKEVNTGYSGIATPSIINYTFWPANRSYINVTIYKSEENFTATLFIPTGRIPDTGQTKCYNDTGEIPCPSPGGDYYGQDGCYSINTPSYTKLDSNGNALPDSATSWTMVRDNVTGLTWEVKTGKDEVQNYTDPHDADNTYTWYDSNPESNGGYAGTPGDGTDTEDFIKALNDANYGGHSDWRLPTIKEMLYIVGRSFPFPGPTIHAAYFPDMVASYYWSSTTSAYNTSSAWYVRFDSGGDDSNLKSYSRYVRAVRGGQSGTFGNSVIGSFDSVNNYAIQSSVPAGGFTDNGDDTVTDSSTGLMWQQETPDTQINWKASVAYGEGLSLGGHADWRLPNTNELRSLVDYSRYFPAIDISYFPDTMASSYWSSTTLANYTYYAWSVNFNHGEGYNHNKSDSHYVRAVRGGQNRLSGHLFLSAPTQAAFLSIGANTQIQWETSGISGNVAITLSRDGGKTWETIIASTPNDGSHPWTVTGPESVNCMLKIEPVSDPSKGTIQGLFTIYGEQKVKGDINGDGIISLADAIVGFQIMTGGQPSAINPAADINGDGKIGMAEVIYILQQVAGL